MKLRPVGERRYPETGRDSRVALRRLVRIMARRAARNYLQHLTFGSTFDTAHFPDSTGEP